MQPPNIYPEGIPFFDARPPQDRPDRLWDDTALQSVTGGIGVQVGVLHPDGQNQLPGALSPLHIVETPTPQGPNVLMDDITFITGPVGAPSVDPANSPPINTVPPSVEGTPDVGNMLTANYGTWIE